MTLLLKNREIENLVSMAEAVEAVEEAFKQLSAGEAVNRPRSRIYLSGRRPGHTYWFNNIAGAVPAFQSMALRIDSALSHAVSAGPGPVREEYIGNFVGLVFLFNTETCELDAVMDDHFISVLRVGATTGVALKHLAPRDAKRVALFGAGEQARGQILAACAVRPIERVTVYSPTAENRRRFAREMAQRLSIDVVPADAPREAVAGADIIMSATNSTAPVFEGEWVPEGATVTAIVGGDYFKRRDEVPVTCYRRCPRVTVNSREQLFLEKQGLLYGLIEEGTIPRETVQELGDVAAGKAPGRLSPEEILLYKNNTGMGIQFAAVGRKVCEAARRRGLGREIPGDWFLTIREEGSHYSP